jgi:peptide/nickel transport system substrate-binding protein
MPLEPARRVITLIVVGCALTLAACGGSQPSSTAATKPLRIVTSFAVGSLDPIEEGFWMPEYGVAETPMRRGTDGQIEPWAIAALDQAGPTTWKLELRRDVTFQNGKALDADALLALMRRQLVRSSSAQSVLKGARARKTATDTTSRSRTGCGRSPSAAGCVERAPRANGVASG